MGDTCQRIRARAGPWGRKRCVAISPRRAPGSRHRQVAGLPRGSGVAGAYGTRSRSTTVKDWPGSALFPPRTLTL